MTTPINDGGPAFPRASGPAQAGVNTTTREGMSLRDWFAGQALSSRGMYGANVREKEVAAECYTIADAMLAAREKGKE